MFFVSLLIWAAIGTIVGALARFFAPQNSFGARGDIAIAIAGAIAGGLLWPMLDVFLGVGIYNAVVGGLLGVSLALPVMRMARPELLRILYPVPKPFDPASVVDVRPRVPLE